MDGCKGKGEREGREEVCRRVKKKKKNLWHDISGGRNKSGKQIKAKYYH